MKGTSKFPHGLSLDALLPTSARWAVMRPEDADPGALFALEQAQIAHAVPARQLEYAAVRHLARRLLPDFGISPCPILNGPDRAPRFPPEVTGSFSHTRELALAVLAPIGNFAAIGCDIEPRLRLPEDVRDQVLSESERAAIADWPDWCDRLVFSAKEAAFKAQYRLSGVFLDFDGFTVGLNAALQRFTATLRVAAGPLRPGDSFEGRYQVTESLIVTVVTIT